MKRPVDLELFYKKKSGVVTDGLVCWIDGQDGLFYSDGSRVPDGTDCAASDNVLVKNRATDELIQVVLSENGIIKSSENSIKFYKTGSNNGTATIDLGASYSVMATEICGGSLVDSMFFTEIGNLVYNGGMRIFQVGKPLSTYKWAAWERCFCCPGFKQGEKDYEIGTINQFFSNSPHDGIGELFLNGTMLRSYNFSGDFETPFEPKIELYRYTWYTGEEQASILPSVRMYNRTLTAEEIFQNYKYEKSLGRVT